MKHIVVQDIKSETKVGKSVYLFDFFFLVTYGAVSFCLVAQYMRCFASHFTFSLLFVPFFLR
ncbi:MAG: hypothetical protein ACLUGF_04295 [Clostridium sp.]